MTSQSQDFAKAVLAGFVAAGLHTDAEIVAAGGPSTTTLTLLRKVARGEESMSKPRNPTWRNIDTAARWPAGYARALWEGVEPPETGHGHLGFALHGVDSGGAVLAFHEWSRPFFELPVGDPASELDWDNPPKEVLALFTDEQIAEELVYRLRMFRGLTDKFFDDLQDVNSDDSLPTKQAGGSPARDVLSLAAKRGRREKAYDDQS
ncbi:hypothetical protein [Phycicoccus jejuensis]|uniref:hypothetical protein n=1 Tax=Phycicoccus jejuensis TaxID=367299 RepID=UPI0004C42138|nr:hypothetical protein [Phycicoccus jejuensis]